MLFERYTHAGESTMNSLPHASVRPALVDAGFVLTVHARNRLWKHLVVGTSLLALPSFKSILGCFRAFGVGGADFDAEKISIVDILLIGPEMSS